MADLKISGLPPATTPLAGTEQLPVVQGGTTDRVTVANLTAGRSVSALSLTSTNDSTINGLTVGKGNSSVSSNTAVGVSALAANTSGTLNTAIGASALASNTAGGLNVAVGRTALATNTIGIENTALGTNALQSNLDGSYNFAGGVYSLVTNSSGSQNTAAGWGSLWFATASNNSAFGYKAGYNLTSGSNCAFFGYDAQPSSVTISNEYTYGNANVTTHRFYGNMTPLGAAKGINFTANTPAAGMTSQLLNWYEEGTWTPNQGAGLTLVGAFSSAGTYTRIGRQVFISGSVSGATSVAVASAGAITTNLPYFAAADATGTAINAANNASSILRVSSATLTAATAIAATTTITFSAVYSV